MDDNKPGFTSIDMSFNLASWASDDDFSRLVYDWNFKNLVNINMNLPQKQRLLK